MVDLLKNPLLEEEKLNAEVPTATLQIYQYIDDALGRKELDTNINRASAAPKCFKQRWYKGRGVKGEQITARAIVNFTLGDLTEHTVKFWILKGCVGPGRLYSEVDFGVEVGRVTIQGGKEIILYDQPETSVVMGGVVVTAHVDGWGKRNSDGKWELIEVKSSNDWNFDKFKDEGPAEYLKQAMVCLSTKKADELGAREVRYFYLRKNTGHLWDRLYGYDQELANEVAAEFQVSNDESEPRAPYLPQPETTPKTNKLTGRIILKYPCTYCPYVALCQPSFTVEFKGNKPVFVINERGTE